MRNQIAALLLSVAFICSAQAQDRGALFKVSGHGHILYLFGTLHVGSRDFFPLEARLTSAVASASTLALEFDPDQQTTSRVMVIRKYGMISSGAEYTGLRTADQERLLRLARASGFDPVLLMKYKPVLLATVLSLAEYQKLGYQVELGIDKFLVRLARLGNTRIVELESFEEQMALLNTLPRKEQVRFLAETLSAIDSGAERTEARKLTEAWATANRSALDNIAAALANDKSVSGRFVRTVLINGRNVALAEKLARLLAEENSTVAAIGILHLLGEHSVPELLRQQGFVVEREY